MQSIESSALEPTRGEMAGLPLGQKIIRLLPVYGLVILTALLILLFSILLPNTFPTLLNLRSIISDKAIIALLSLAAMIPMASGRIDLTVGYGIVLWHILAISLQTMFGVPWPLAVIIVLLLGAATGFLNGLLVEVARIDSFIATLGTGTVLYAIAMWHSGGRQVVGSLPEGFVNIAGADLLGLPVTAFYVVAVAIVLWLMSEHTPIGRALYVIGSNPKAAVLNGIPLQKCVMGAFVGRAPCRPLPAWCWRRACRSARPVSGSSFCCRRWSAPSSAPPPSGRDASTSGAPWSAWRSWRSASRASSSSAARSTSSRCSTA